MTSQPTCHERLPQHLAGRLADFVALNAAANVYDPQTLRNCATDHHETLRNLDVLPTDDYSDDNGYTDRSAEEYAERAREVRHEYILGVSTYTTFRVELSTGGPGDWLEVVCTGNTPNYEPAGNGEHYEVERIVYHFADWFDHAERQLDGDDFNAAEEFARNIVPELIG